MTKTLNQIFFFPHQNKNFFLEKNHNAPPPFKLNGRSLMMCFLVFFYVFLGKSMDRTFLSVGSPFIEEGGKMP
jgi:hypothetical protein